MVRGSPWSAHTRLLRVKTEFEFFQFSGKAAQIGHGPATVNRLVHSRKSGNLPDRSKLTLFARKSVAMRLVLFARLFYFWDDCGEQISIGNTTGYGSGRTDELRDASLRADGRYFECASIAGAAARFEESDQSSGYKNYHGWNRTKRGGAAAGSTCCVFGA